MGLKESINVLKKKGFCVWFDMDLIFDLEIWFRIIVDYLLKEILV